MARTLPAQRRSWTHNSRSADRRTGAALSPFWAKMNLYWASKLMYIRPAPRSASSQVTNAMTRLPGTRSAPPSGRCWLPRARRTSASPVSRLTPQRLVHKSVPNSGC